MKKKLKRIFLSVGALFLFLVSFSFLKTNNYQKENFVSQKNNDFKNLSDETIISQLNETTRNEIEINGIKVSKPLIAGPENLYIKQNEIYTNEVFDPLNYGFYVYDSLDENINENLEFLDLEKVNLEKIGTYNFTIIAKNKYKMKNSKTFTINVVNEQEYKRKTSFEYTPYTINGNTNLYHNANLIYTAGADWQLLLPIVLKSNQRIKIQQLNPKYIYDDLKIIKLHASGNQIQKTSNVEYRGFPFIDKDINSVYDKSTKTWTEKNNNTTLNLKYDGVYLLKTPKNNLYHEQPRYKISIIDENNQEISTLSDENKLVSYFYYKNNEKPRDFSREDLFVNKWKKNLGPAIIKNKALTWALPVEDLQEIYYRDQPAQVINESILKEVNQQTVQMFDDYKYLTGLHSGVSNGKSNVYFNASTLAFSFKNSSESFGARATAFGIHIKTNNYRMGNNARDTRNHPGTFWINNVDNGLNVPEFLKHEFGHVFQIPHLRLLAMKEITNVMLLFYTDFQDQYRRKEQFSEFKNLDEKTKKILINNEIWPSFQFKGKGNERKSYSLLNIKEYNQKLISNPEYAKNIFETTKVNEYQNIRHIPFLNIFSKYGWEAMTYVWTKYREIQNEEIIVDGLGKSSTDLDYFGYLISEYTQTNLISYFERFGFKLSETVKNAILLKGWKSVDMMNSLINDKEKISNLIKNNQDLLFEISLIDNKLVNSAKESSFAELILEDKDLNYLLNKNAYLFSFDKNNKLFIKDKKTILSKNIIFENLPAGIYQVVIPDYRKDDLFFDSKIWSFTLKEGETKVQNVEFEQIIINNWWDYFNLFLEINYESDNREIKLKRTEKKALNLIEKFENKKISNKSFYELFEIELFHFEKIKEKLLEYNSQNQEIINKINKILNKVKEKNNFVYSENNPRRISIQNNNDLNFILEKIKYVEKTTNKIRVAKISDIKRTNLFFEKTNKLKTGTYFIEFFDKNLETYKVEIEVN